VQEHDAHPTDAMGDSVDAFFVLDGGWRFTYLNSAAKRVLAPRGGELLGEDLRESLPGTLVSSLYGGLWRAVEERVTVDFRHHHPALDRFFEVRAHPIQSGAAVSFRGTDRRENGSGRGGEWLWLMERALDASSAGALITDATRPDNPVVYTNRALRRMTGYSAEEFAGSNCRFLQRGDCDQPELDELREALRNGESWKGVLRNYRKDGSLFYNELYISPVRDGDGKVTHYIGIQSYVTDRLEAERERRESERTLGSVLTQYGAEMITILEPDGTPRYESPAVRQALGYNHLEESGDALYERIHPDDVWKMREAVGETLATPGTHPAVEYRIRHADGSWRHFESVGSNRVDDPEVAGVVVTTRDITSRRRAEQCRKARYEVECVTSLGTSLEDVAPGVLTGLCDALGWAVGELWVPDGEPGAGVLRRREARYASAAGFEEFEEASRRVVFSYGEGLPGEAWQSGELVWSPDVSREPGSRRSAAEACGLGIALAFPIPLGAEVPGVLCLFGYGTQPPDPEMVETLGSIGNHLGLFVERQRTGETIRRQATAMESLRDGVGISGPDGTFIYLNQAHADLYGYHSPDELVGKTWRDLYSEESVAWFERNVVPVLAEQGSWSGEATGVRKDGSEFPQELSLTVLEDGGTICVFRDITERRRNEEARRLLASIVDDSEEPIVGSTTGGIVTSWNPAAQRLFGYTAGEMLGESVGILDPGDEPEEDPESHREAGHAGEPRRQETVRVAKDGTRIEVSVARSPIRDAAGNVTGTSAIFKDVSGRKAAERALAESEARFRSLVELSPDTIFVHSEGILVYINPAGVRLLGVERPEEMIGKPIMSFVHPDHRAAAQERVDRLQARGGHIGPVEEEVLRLDGGSVEVEVAGLPITYGGRPAIQSLARDITERKRAQEALRQSEERYRAIVEDQTEMVCRFLPDKTLTFVNDAYCDFFGVEREDLGEIGFMSLVPEEERQALEEHLFSLSPENPTGTVEHRVTNAAGEARCHQWTDRALFDERGELAGFQAVGRDITGRKEAEEALRKERNLLRGVMDSTKDAIFSKDPEHRFRLSNAAHQQILGAGSEEELIGKTNADYWGEEIAAPFHTDDRRVLDHGESIVDREERIHGASGEEMWISTTKVPLHASDGTIEGLVAVSRDVTERHREQDELALTLSRLGSLIQNMPSGILIEDEHRNIRQANESITRMFEMGVTAEELTRDDCYAAARGVTSLLAEPERFVERSEEILAKGTPVTGEEIRLTDGRVYERDYVPVFVRGEYRGHMWQYHDLTGRKRMEEALRQSEERLRTIFEETALGISIADPERRLLETNSAYQRITGYTQEELSGMPISGLTHPDDVPLDWERNAELAAGTLERYQREKRYIRKNGETIWIQSTVSAVRGEDGEPRFLIGTVEDITGRKRAQEALAENARLLRAVTRGAPIILFAMDLEGVITLSEGKALELIGRKPGEVVGRRVFEAYAEIPQLVHNARRALAGEEAEATVEASGLAFESRYSPMRDGDGEVIGAIGVATDITSKRELEKELEHRAFHDPLTDLPNRELFMDRLEHALTRTSRRGGQVVVMFLDLDDFKHVNDSMGHSAGDRLLIEAGRRIGSCIREEDTVARLGGDEFAVLLEEIPSRDFPAQIAQRIAGELRQPIDLTPGPDDSSIGREVVSTTSLGIAFSDPEGTAVSAEGLLQRADSALYRAKETGKDHYESFHQEMQDRSSEVVRIGRDLRLALERDELVVHYQPKTNVETGDLVGFEALVRWNHPERGLIYPDAFIPLAEENGLILPLGRRVLYRACEQAAEWASLYPGDPGRPSLKMSVNVSARQLQSPELLADVAEALSESGLEPSSLVLEITESVIIGRDRSEASTLRKLKELGVGLAIDDFGSGYSSLSYLKDLPVDILKIDRSLISGMGRDTAKTAIVSAVLAIARALGLQPVAEGLETPGELEELRRLGCKIGQGYYWSKPLPAHEASSFL